MRFTVTWLETAQSRLTEIWLNSSDRAAITFAADAIDQELAEDAGHKGAVLSEEGLRSLKKHPLKVAFAVREDDRIVEVGYVGRIS